MRVLAQRVSRGSVTVSGQVTGSIEAGLVLLVGIRESDDNSVLAKMANKVVNLRIFNDASGKFDRSLLDIDGGALVVSQFTLYADTRKGRRPSFTGAARPDHAEPLVERFVTILRETGVKRVETGVFGANMSVDLCNEGPVTIWLDSDDWQR